MTNHSDNQPVAGSHAGSDDRKLNDNQDPSQPAPNFPAPNLHRSSHNQGADNDSREHNDSRGDNDSRDDADRREDTDSRATNRASDRGTNRFRRVSKFSIQLRTAASKIWRLLKVARTVAIGMVLSTSGESGNELRSSHPISVLSEAQLQESQTFHLRAQTFLPAESFLLSGAQVEDSQSFLRAQTEIAPAEVRSLGSLRFGVLPGVQAKSKWDGRLIQQSDGDDEEERLEQLNRYLREKETWGATVRTMAKLLASPIFFLFGLPSLAEKLGEALRRYGRRLLPREIGNIKSKILLVLNNNFDNQCQYMTPGSNLIGHF